MPITKTLPFLPGIFQTDANQKFLNATLDQLVTQPNLVPINGYVGRKFSPGKNDFSKYVQEPTTARSTYQLEPGVIVKDSVSGNVDFHITYPEVLQKISYLGGKVNNPSGLWSNEFYSFDPHVNLDAFINFGQYYWLPSGPQAVDVFSGAADLERTFYIYPNNGTQVYNISGYGNGTNPDLVLVRGGSYQFKVNQPGKSFWIQSDPGLSGKQLNNNNLSSRQVFGVSNNGDDRGTVTFNVPSKTAQDLYVDMNVVQNVDLVTTLSYSQIQGQLLSTFLGTYTGIDGQRTNLNNKYLVFGQPYEDDAYWTADSTTVADTQRYGVWQIELVVTGSDYTFNLNYITSIPTNNKVIVQSGVSYGNTEWYKDPDGTLKQVPVITANLNTLYYQDGSLEGQVGIIKLVEVNSHAIDVPTEILGKQNYISPNGVTFTNGLKIRFDTGVTPANYENNEYYVDGVGNSIRLTLVSDLDINEPISGANFDPTVSFDTLSNASLNASKDHLTITTTDAPDGTTILVGTFPNAVNPNYVIDQDLTVQIPYRGGLNQQGEHASALLRNGIIGMTLPGVVINGTYNGCYVPGVNGTQWHYNSSLAKINGQDSYGGYPGSENGYHYTDSTFITANAWGNVSGFTAEENGYLNSDGHSKLIGFASDGYPIYGPYGYVDPNSSGSSVIRMKSSYVYNGGLASRPSGKTVTVTANATSSSNITVSSTFGLNPGMRLNSNDAGITAGSVWIVKNGLQTAEGLEPFYGAPTQVQLSSNVTILEGSTVSFEYNPGTFIEDYSYSSGSGTLDQYNGRFCVTPDFPKGTYAYFATQESGGTPTYPYFVGSAFYGSLEINTSTSLTTPDYIVINRSSRDQSPWSRCNRWFHKDILALSSLYNRTDLILDQDNRAKRPIIEFEPDLQLYDFGKRALQPVDLYDTDFQRPFLDVEGLRGVYIDSINVVNGMRVIFAADEDPLTRGKIWIVNFVDQVGFSATDPKVIHLTLAADGDVQENDVVSVLNGVDNNGKSFWYNSSVWDEGQIKITQNQAPYFDVLDQDGVSFGDRTKYPAANTTQTFVGTKIFSYKEGTGADDPVLGFPLAYKNINNVGDIQFENNFDTDTFLYNVDRIDYTAKVNTGYLYKNNSDDSQTKLNVWTKAVEQSKQYQIIPYIYDGINNEFRLDVTPAENVTIPNLLVYVNYKKISPADYQIFNTVGVEKSIVIRQSLLTEGDNVDLLVYSSSISQLGYFEVPPNLNFNAQNATVSAPTLGEMRNHIAELTENSLEFTGSYPGNSNLRDVFVTAQGGTILQQSAPTTFASMFLCDDKLNIVNGVQNAQLEYTRFKNKFLTIASQSDNIDYNDPSTAVDIIIQQINQVKNKNFPWFYSDMVPYGANKNIITYNVFNPDQRNYEITNIFSNSTLGNKAILIYLNGDQLLYGSDYTFLTTGPGVTITSNVTLAVDDTITIVEYNNTDGNWIPETPTKLGLYPKFTPEIYTDYSFRTPSVMIRGHDGSLTPSFGDFRDDLLLELEKRIYNNIKVDYNEDLFSVYNSKPGKFRNVGYTVVEYNRILSKLYLQWIGFNKIDYVTNKTYLLDNAFTFNYASALDEDGSKLPGSWRACFDYFYDTQYPSTRPWEMLGFTEQPDWWVSTYGPAPYTSGNTILWTHLQDGYIAQGPRQGYDEKFARPGLLGFIPVNENGEIFPPLGLLTTQYTPSTFGNNWAVGQWSPVETAWRNSSEFPYAFQIVNALVQPAKYFSFGIAADKYRYNTDVDQYLVTDTNARLTQMDIPVNGYIDDSGQLQRSAGYLNWISDYLTTIGITSKDQLVHYIQDYNVQLSYRMAGFSDKKYLKVLAEQNSPSAINQSVLVPDADIDIVINKSSPLSNPRYSAVIIQKTATGFKVSGYDQSNPYFTLTLPATTGKYADITVLKKTVRYWTNFTNTVANIPYETEFTTEQQLASFFSAYERNLLNQGFRFSYFDQDLGSIRNWQLSTKEFLFWMQQSWPVNSILVVGPTADTIQFVVRNAVVDSIDNTIYGSKIVTQNFVVLDSDAYSVVRDNNSFRATLDNKNGDLIAFIGFNLVQYEHLIIFNNRTQFNDIIYDPSSGQRQYKLKLVGSKTGGWTGSLAAQGFIYNRPGVPSWVANTDYLKGDLVEYKNFYYAASTNLPGADEFKFSDWLGVDKDKIKTGLLSNFSTIAGQAEDFYDTESINLENKFDIYSLGLIGFRNRDYLNDLGMDDTTQVKFYQGFIKEKGTHNAINALSQISFDDEQTSINVNEEWAFRVGAYGSLETNQFVEIVLDENYVLNNPTSMEVNTNNSVTFSSLYTNQSSLYKTAVTPFTPPFLLNRTDDSNRSDDIQTAGYVNIEDVDTTIFDLNDINTLNDSISSLGIGSVIWAAKNYQQTWDVYRVNETNGSVVRISNALNNKVLLETDFNHNLEINDTIIMSDRGSKFTGFYRVLLINSLKTFTVEYNGDLTGFNNVTLDNGTLYKLVSLRYPRASYVAYNIPENGWKANSKVWIDEDTVDGTWAVYNKTEPWVADRLITGGVISSNVKFGSSVKLSSDNNFAVVGMPGRFSNQGAIVNYLTTQSGQLTEDTTITPTATSTIGLGTSLDSGDNYVVSGAPDSSSGRGHVYVYTRNFLGQISQQQILAANTSNACAFGTSISISDDDQWLYVGAPNNSNVYIYGFDNTITSANTTVVGNGVGSTYSLSFTPVSAEVVKVSQLSNVFVPYVDYTTSGSNIIFTNPLSGNVTVRQSPGYRLIGYINGNAGSKFGYSVATSTGGTQVVIGAPLETVTALTNSGSIKIYDRSIENFIASGSSAQTFGGVRPVTSISKVYLNGELQTLNVDYTVILSTSIKFTSAPEAGSLVTIETNQFNLIQNIVPQVPFLSAQFGYSVDLCPNNCSVYVGAPYRDNVNIKEAGSVYRLLNQGRVYGSIVGTVQNPTLTLGNSIRLNDFEVIFGGTTLSSLVTQINDANIPGVTATNQNGYLALTCDSQLVTNKLRVLPGSGSALSVLGLNVFKQVEVIINPTQQTSFGPYFDHFGLNVKINDNSDILVVSSPDATTIEFMQFDGGTTIFDTNSTNLRDDISSGSVWILSYLGDSRNTIDYPGNFNFIQQLTPGSLGILSPFAKFGCAVDITAYQMLVGSYAFDSVAINGGIVYEFLNTDGLKGWDIYRSEEPRVDIDCLIKNYIYSNSTQTIIDSLDYIDPVKGKILGQAEQEITYKTDYDPAVYNKSTDSELSQSTTFHWNNTQVGQIWWDLSTVRYLDYEQGSIKYRAANWGREFPNSSIDVYEWIESIYPPSRYVTSGGNGVPKYSNDTAYATIAYVDPISNLTTVKYFFWVKDKTTVTINQFGRQIPTTTIADYIRNPKNSGIKYLAALKDNCVAVYNIVGQPTGQDLILHVDYATQLNSNIIHSEYALLSESENRVGLIPHDIYNKVVDSASGIDSIGNVVPDPRLAPQNRYGISIRPRQSIFVDRNQSVKEMVSYVNSVFAKNVISQGYDLTTLSGGEEQPLPNTGAYDISVPTYEVLGYINIIIQPVGYKVLVESDSTVSGLWTIYTKTSSNTWLLSRVQSYRTSDYWKFIDWYAEGFDSTVRPDHTVNTLADLSTIRILPTEIVKVLNNGQGKWLLLQVFANAVITIGIQDGTIELTSNLYQLEQYGMAFGNGNFDSQRFDQNPSIEIRKILEALQNDIFINQLSQDFVTLFFVFVYYVLNEQKYIDWAFKTSFISVLHKLRGLNQPPIYRNENQDYYKQYIEEVKPYHTTIREYVTDYQGVDNFNGYTTDFDVPAYYDTVFRTYRSPSGEFIQDAGALQQPQYKDWLLNYSYVVGSIIVLDAGSGYTLAPEVTITGSDIGNDAVVRAIVSGGKISKIEVLYPGTNYLTQPVVTISGGNGTGGRAYAILENTVVRKLKTTLVYDRLTYGTTVLEWTANTAYSQGDILTYDGVAYIVNDNFTSGSSFLGNDLTVYPANGFNTANDRIQAFYQPESGLPGRDLGLLQTGIDYPGVAVDAPLYNDAGGFDVSAFDMTQFDNLTLDEDGTYIISDSILDTKITSSYTDTGLGIRPEDIVVDGGEYVDTYSSHAPEELVPGRVFDTLDMTITTLSVAGQSAAYSWWLTNDRFYVESIEITGSGSGYSTSNIAVTLDGTTGSGTSLSPQLDANGNVTAINVLTTGFGYTTIPNVVITGGNASPATAIVRLRQNIFNTFEYRVFKDMNDSYQYMTVAPSSSTILRANLAIDDTTIQVDDATNLFNPSPSGPNPGVIFIEGERITYWINESGTNTLRNIRRGTGGTGIKAHTLGTPVVDGSSVVLVPQSDNYTWTPNANVTSETTSTAGFTFLAGTEYIRSNLWLNQGTGLITSDISVEFQGNLLANVITTEDVNSITTNQAVDSPADGAGLYASTKTQAVFIKQP